MGSMSGKNAVVTGGSRGIGRAICLELARRGANVVFSYAGNTAAADKTLEELKALGVEARAIQGNVADPRRRQGPDRHGRQGAGGHPHPGQQRGHHPRRPGHGHERGRLRRRHRNQPQGRVPVHEGGHPPHDEGALRPHRQHELGGGPAGQPRPGQLLRQQGRPDRHDQVPGQGDGRPGHHRQRGGPRLHLHRYDRGPARRRPAGHAVHHPGGPRRQPRGRGRRGGVPGLGGGGYITGQVLSVDGGMGM